MFFQMYVCIRWYIKDIIVRGSSVFHTKYLGMAVQTVQYSEVLQLCEIVTNTKICWNIY